MQQFIETPSFATLPGNGIGDVMRLGKGAAAMAALFVAVLLASIVMPLLFLNQLDLPIPLRTVLLVAPPAKKKPVVRQVRTPQPAQPVTPRNAEAGAGHHEPSHINFERNLPALRARGQQRMGELRVAVHVDQTHLDLLRRKQIPIVFAAKAPRIGDIVYTYTPNAKPSRRKLLDDCWPKRMEDPARFPEIFEALVSVRALNPSAQAYILYTGEMEAALVGSALRLLEQKNIQPSVASRALMRYIDVGGAVNISLLQWN